MHATASSPALWLRAIRAPSLTATLMPAVATALLGTLLGWAIAPLTALFAGLGVLLVQIGVNLLNDVEDDNRGIDRPGRLGGSGVLQDGSLPPRALAHPPVAPPPSPSSTSSSGSAGGGVASLELGALRRMSPEELCVTAERLGVDDARELRKADLVLAVLEAHADRRGETHAEGVLEVLADGFGFLVMEWLEGGTLEQDIAERRRRGRGGARPRRGWSGRSRSGGGRRSAP